MLSLEIVCKLNKRPFTEEVQARLSAESAQQIRNSLRNRRQNMSKRVKKDTDEGTRAMPTNV